MNGELNELYNKLHTDLEVFKGIMTERWTNHARRADRLEKHIEGIFKSIDSVKGIRGEMLFHRYLLGGVILSGIVLGLWIKGA